jgi:hypothetical protein
MHVFSSLFISYVMFLFVSSQRTGVSLNKLLSLNIFNVNELSLVIRITFNSQ